MKFNLSIHAGNFESLSEAVHELKEILNELENLTDEELFEELEKSDYETERFDSILNITEAED